MKQRPRRAENRVAEILSDFFLNNSLLPVERIPVLGRTGPDLTVNEVNLIVDVKSRKSCPKGTFKAVEKTGKACNPHTAAFELDRLQEALVEGRGLFMSLKESKMVTGWLEHMHEWTKENAPDGISAIVLHRPGLPYGKSVLVVFKSDVGLLTDRISSPDVIGTKDAFMRLLDKGAQVISKKGSIGIDFSRKDLITLQNWTRRQL